MTVSSSYRMERINFDVLHWIGFALQACRETEKQGMQISSGLAPQLL